MQQLLELPDIGGSEMFIRGVEHFQHDSSVTFNGHTQCLTGFTQVILKPQPQRVVMRVGTLGQNGANRPQFIDTTVAEIPRYKTLDVMDGMKLLRSIRRSRNGVKSWYSLVMGRGASSSKEAMSRISRESPEYAFICSELRA